MSFKEIKPLHIESWNVNKSKPIDIPSGSCKYKYAHLVKNSKEAWVKIMDVSCDLYQGTICKTPADNFYNKGDRFIFHKENIHSLRHSMTSPN